MDALECMPSDELFTHTDPDGTVRHFNTTAMAAGIRDKLLAPTYNRVDLKPPFVEHVRKNHGVEKEGVARILHDNERLAIPVFFCHMEDGKFQLLVDGAHRVVARWERGLKWVDGLFFTEEQWTPYLVTGFDVPHVIGKKIVSALGPENAEALRAAGLIKRPTPNRVKF